MILFVKNHLVFLMLLMMAFLSCQKNDHSTPTPIPTRVCLSTQHHGVLIPESTVYIQYRANQNEFVGYENYEAFDTSFVLNEQAQGCIENLPLGTHWFMGRGFDDGLNEEVRGLLKLELNLRQTVLDTVLMVSEE